MQSVLTIYEVTVAPKSIFRGQGEFADFENAMLKCILKSDMEINLKPYFFNEEQTIFSPLFTHMPNVINHFTDVIYKCS